jgi:SH3/ankyrin repeat-containing protein
MSNGAKNQIGLNGHMIALPSPLSIGSNGQAINPTLVSIINTNMHQNSGTSSPTSRSRSISSDDHGFGSASLSQNSNGSPNIEYAYPRRRLYPSIPNRTFICVKPYKPAQPGEIELKRGEIIELLSVGDSGFWEGRLINCGAEGWFKAACVEEFCLPKDNVGGSACADSIVVKRKTLMDLLTHNNINAPRTVVLQKGKKGFGFVLRGAKSMN